jgi:hypothetical protein
VAAWLHDAPPSAFPRSNRPVRVLGSRADVGGADAGVCADIDEREVMPRVVVAHLLRATNRQADSATVAAIGRCCASSRANCESRIDGRYGRSRSDPRVLNRRCTCGATRSGTHCVYQDAVDRDLGRRSISGSHRAMRRDAVWHRRGIRRIARREMLVKLKGSSQRPSHSCA